MTPTKPILTLTAFFLVFAVTSCSDEKFNASRASVTSEGAGSANQSPDNKPKAKKPEENQVSSAVLCRYVINGEKSEGSNATDCDRLRKIFDQAVAENGDIGHSNFQCTFVINGDTIKETDPIKCDQLKKEHELVKQ